MKLQNTARHLALLASMAAGLIASAGSASAQYFPGYAFGPRYAPGYVGPVFGFARRTFVHRFAPPRPIVEEYLHPAEVRGILAEQGFRKVNVLARQGDVFVVNAVSPRTGAVRLIVDAYEGEVVERYAMAGNPPPRQSAPRAPSAPRVTIPNAPAPLPRESSPGDSGGTMPLPPRRPVAAAAPAPAAPTPAATPAAPNTATTPVSRRPSEWSPINSVPPAALE
jgi:hypothetical protein